MHRLRLRYGDPLLDPAARVWAGVIAACCAVVVAGLGVIFAHQTAADQFDHVVDSPVITWLDHHPGLAVWLAFPGSPQAAVPLTAAVVAGCLLARRLNGALLAAVAVPAAAGVNDGLCKPLFHRTYLGILSYPSGHTAAMSALAAALVILLYVAPRSATARVARVAVWSAAWAAAVVVAAGVIGMRWHYFTDTVAGAAVGAGTVCVLALLLDLPARLTRPAGPSVPAG